MAPLALSAAHLLTFYGLPSPPPHIKPSHPLHPISFWPLEPPNLSLYIHSCIDPMYRAVLVLIVAGTRFFKWCPMDPLSIEKIRAMNKFRNGRRQEQLPIVSVYVVATFVICLLLISPAWFPSLCSRLSSFFLTTLPDLVTAFLLSPKCLFVVGNLIVAFLVGESRLAPKRDADQLSFVNEIHEEHVKRNMAVVTKATTTAVVVADHSASLGVGVVGEEVELKEEEEGEEEELHKRVEDFIARVKKQRKLEAKSFFDVDR